ncbi:hypothetical protein ACGF0J_19905 [Nonomuraea sp. NPDC047897]|uniref:hypothetical protein n=1 Tax=Nonomuraea sp. NPDC047897 TaxID=3364346 RepID=UPI00371A3ED7
MRIVSRILIGAAAATAVAVGAPVAAQAATSTGAQSGAQSGFEADWGPYFSGDHRAKATGHVSVEKKPYKHWYWKTVVVKKKVCKPGQKHCKIVIKKTKKRAWVWKHRDVFTVHSTLSSKKWWGGKKCAWETFKVVEHDGDTYFRKFRNCTKFPAEFSFSGKDAAHILVKVSRGHFGGPTGQHSDWKDVYHAAA